MPNPQIYASIVAGNPAAPTQLYVAIVDANGNIIGSTFAAPQGRLTPTTLTPTPIAPATAVATVFYTPYQGNVVPLYDGTVIQPTQFAELSNVLANSATGKAGPAAGVAAANYDLFVWNDAGTLRLTRGPLWTTSATVTTPVASPGLVNWASHGLAIGTPVSFSGGVLPTGIVAGTTYYVIAAGYTANVFEISATPGGGAINFTGSSSGTQTGTAGSDIVRSADTALIMVNGLLLNNVAITNGPAAQRGTYVGTIRTDAAGATVTYSLGTAASGGGLANFGLWNAYNQIEQTALVLDNGTADTYSSNTLRARRGSATFRVNLIAGLNFNSFYARHSQLDTTAATSGSFYLVHVGLDTTSATSTGQARGQIATSAAVAITLSNTAYLEGLPGLGFHFISGNEQGDNTTTITIQNTSVPSSLAVKWKW